jgi:flavin reductase (DIM6/NTAB) family NADH-FMN oxidoreductase RutF
MVDKAKAVGHIPSGLFIVCAQDQDEKIIDGYLASWIQQVSFEPLLLSIAIKPGRPAYDLITSGKTFCINVIGDHDKSFMKHFWKGYDPHNNPFEEEVEHTSGENGGVIMTQAKSSIECVMKEKLTPGDHEIIIAEVLASYIQDEDSKPLSHIRKSGMDY